MGMQRDEPNQSDERKEGVGGAAYVRKGICKFESESGKGGKCKILVA
jgi:hypothetical protein